MDPASIVGLAASTVTLLGLLGQGVLSVKAMLHGVRDVHENTRGFGEELDAFHFSLTILDFEIRNGSLIPEIQGWWGATKLDALLTNARKTFSRLETIFHDIQRQRLILQRPREHIRTNLYDREIGHLRLRINTYTLAFNIPVVLLAIHGTRSPNTQMDQNLNLSLLVDRISQLEEGITSISNDIRTFSDGYVANEPTGSPQVESPIRRESEELVGIARTLVSDASSVAASESAQSPPSTVRAFDPAPTPEDPRATPQQGSSDIAECANVGESGHDASCSVAGVPLTTQRRMRVEAWISQPQATRSHSSVPSDPSSMPDIASITFTETSNFSEALHTPPSTINSQDGGDIEAELTEKRYKRARDLMEQQKFREAIPHLKRTLGAIKTVGENPVFQGTREYQKAQYLLATALMGADPNSAEAGTILVELFESRGSQPLERLSAAHLLAQLYLNQHPDDCTEAKKMCLTAVKGRNATLGRTHPETYASIALLCSICQVSNDSDEEVWRDMLYEAQRRHNTDEWKEQRNESPRYRTLEGHSSLVYSVVFSSDGRLVASGSADMTIRLWDTATGAVRCTLGGHSDRVYGVAFSPDGRLVVSGLYDRTVRLWDTATGAVRRTLEGHPGTVYSVAFSPDGRLVASGSGDKTDMTVRLWSPV
ncbi:hypothetical protein FGG08_006127 [Glutinoglossum americanum]|uniref:Mitochondrial division protein 1 n=1 Tax=Glutinoglossum americanum TaxID=1670608 RepID=A0A9P8I277_9PEZI|nr:hypothetical protein FGG08_006127 [Glutinoglossum americanum]